MEFKTKEPPFNLGADISEKSFETIKEELKKYHKIQKFDNTQKEVIIRLIHTSSCFEQVIDNIYFSKNAISNIQKLLLNKATIITEVNMIKVGLNRFYLNKYDNEVICYVNEPEIYETAKRQRVTRSYAAAKKAIKKYKNQPLILVCGNAPTFIYAAINTLIEEKVDLNSVALLLFPVGFVNVIESKEYGKEFIEHFDTNGIIMQGRFGGSTLAVATLHAIYKQM